jgi:hypothetical protein
MSPIFFLVVVLFAVVVLSFVKIDSVIENAYFNIPTRSCRPTRFYSPYDYRGLVEVPTTLGQIPFEQSEAVGENYRHCSDDFVKTFD